MILLSVAEGNKVHHNKNTQDITMAEMNSITSGLSGLALRRDGVKSNVHSGSTLESYVLPANLRIDDQETNLALSCMEVIKVSKVSIYMLCCDQSQQTYHMLIYYFHSLLFKINTLEWQATDTSFGNIIKPSFHINHFQSSSGESDGVIKKLQCRSS